MSLIVQFYQTAYKGLQQEIFFLHTLFKHLQSVTKDFFGLFVVTLSGQFAPGCKVKLKFIAIRLFGHNWFDIKGWLLHLLMNGSSSHHSN